MGMPLRRQLVCSAGCTISHRGAWCAAAAGLRLWPVQVMQGPGVGVQGEHRARASCQGQRHTAGRATEHTCRAVRGRREPAPPALAARSARRRIGGCQTAGPASERGRGSTGWLARSQAIAPGLPPNARDTRPSCGQPGSPPSYSAQDHCKAKARHVTHKQAVVRQRLRQQRMHEVARQREAAARGEGWVGIQGVLRRGHVRLVAGVSDGRGCTVAGPVPDVPPIEAAPGAGLLRVVRREGIAAVWG
jgi:hypothetical protein